MKKGIVLLAFVLVTRLAMSQDRYFFLALDAHKPLSNTSWINDLSTRGVKIGYRVFINDRFSAGLEISSNAFDQYHPTETVQNATGALTTDYFKYLYSYSATVSGQYYFMADDEERFFPYAGLGLGPTTMNMSCITTSILMKKSTGVFLPGPRLVFSTNLVAADLLA